MDKNPMGVLDDSSTEIKSVAGFGKILTVFCLGG